MNGHVERRTSKTKGTRYGVLVFVDAAHGGPRWERHGTFDRERQAEAKLVKVLNTYHAGVYRQRSTMTVRELADAWLTEHVAALRPGSRSAYRRVCEGFIIPEFGDELDGAPLRPDYFSRGFTAALKRRGLPPFRFHDLRHALATEMLESGERVDVVQRQLGHASPAVTLHVYAHVRPGETEKAAARYGKRFADPQPSEAETAASEDAIETNRNQSATKSADVLSISAARSRKRPA